MRYQQVRHSILNAIPKRQSPQGAGQTLGTSPAATQPGMKASPYANSPGMNGHAQAAANGYARHTGGSAGLMFHASPFYNIETAVTSIYTCPSKSRMWRFGADDSQGRANIPVQS